MNINHEHGPLSIWALCTGYAEGTRTLNGGFTPAYFGHEDPLVPGRMNYGSFSWDCERDKTMQVRPTDWDRSYIQAQKRLLPPDLPKDPLTLLNVLDLWVQSPQAVTGWDDELSEGKGYLRVILKNGYRALNPNLRVEAFRNTRGELETGFTPEQLAKDQHRRAKAIGDMYLSPTVQALLNA